MRATRAIRLLLLLPCLAAAQTPEWEEDAFAAFPTAVVTAADGGTSTDAGTPPDRGTPADGGAVRVERALERTEDGFAVFPDGPAADGGAEAQVTLTPPRLLLDSPAKYPPALARSGVSGEVTLQLHLGTAGEVLSAEVVQRVHPELDAAALHAAAGLLFEPARLGAEPVEVQLHFTYRFEAPLATPDGGAPEPFAIIRGVVLTKGTRRPVGNAAVSADDTHVATTDPQGRFELRVPPGAVFLNVVSPAHLPGNFQEDLGDGQVLEVVYRVAPKIINPYESIVRGERERTEVSRVSLHEQEIREVPGTAGDPFKVVMLLPGVSGIVSGIAYPVVRGTEPAATGYFIDGIRVPILYHLLLGPSIVHPDFIDSIDFFPGAAPALYGRLMGGVIEGHLSRPRDSGLSATAYADFINAGGFVEQAFEQTGTSVTLAGRMSYTGWLLKLGANAFLGDQAGAPSGVFDFWDYQGRIEQKLGQHTLRLLAFGSNDRVGVIADDDSPITGLVDILFHRVDLRWRHPWGEGQLEAGVTWGWDRLGTTFGDQNAALDYSLNDEVWRGRVNWSGPVHRDVSLVVGVDAESHRGDAVGVISGRLPEGPDGQPVDFETELRLPVSHATLVGAYAEVKWRPTDTLTISPSLRVDNYALAPTREGFGSFQLVIPEKDFVVAEPRLVARWRLAPTLTLKAGGGLFHQPPTTLLSIPAVDYGTLRFGLQEGVQLSAGAEWRFFGDMELWAEAYFNPRMRSLEVTLFDEEAIAAGQGQTPGAPGGVGEIEDVATEGYAYGLELLLRQPLGHRWFGWISYTLQRSVRRQQFFRYDDTNTRVGTDEAWIPFVFDQTHVLNAVLSYKFESGWTAGATFHFNTGVPELGPLSSRGLRPVMGPGGPQWVFEDRDRVGRLPPFPRLDVRVARAWAFDTFELELYLDVLNVAASAEVIRYEYRTPDPFLGSGGKRGLEKRPLAVPVVLPTLGLKGSY